ncbi:aspartate--tRNA ligase [Haploplasma modicum]|uniref:aspartate--tRNA ligase n=1 Tax=Haploplasma modicum TaxID=2150 RepID=UPI00138ABF6D|nr:aspartate--tRNA ligase [Haploplasma modicum]
MRTHYNNELTIKNLNQTVTLNGWVSKARNLGSLLFVDLRDRFGITQLTFHEKSVYELATTLKNEYVIEVTGKVIERQSKNPNMVTGEIEVLVDSLTILSEAKQTPIIINDTNNVLEETRLKYRYLDLRGSKQQQYLIKRHEITQAVRKVLVEKGFYELETPFLGKSTPEGARDYLVPSRVHPSKFYALPQSPQMYKQLFMVAGFEKYFQFAKCFRDEDLRADRQPEFTQIDIEASFVNENDIMSFVEEMLRRTFKEVLNINIETPFLKMPYEHAISKYGSDKPDMRFEMLIEDYTNIFKSVDVPFFNNEEHISGIIASNSSSFTRKKIDELTNLVKKNHGKALAFIKNTNNEYTGSIAKFLNEDTFNKLNLKDNEILFLVPGNYDDVKNSLGALRIEVAKELDIIDNNSYKFLWVTDWPLLEFDLETNRYYAKHHPFTAPKTIEELRDTPKEAIARAYDVVLNGYELGGGSIRIHQQAMQDLMFKTLGFTEQEIKEQFGFFVDALSYGTPPHGGIALGLDRLTMLMTKTENIRDVVAFPKTQNARDLMMDAPSFVTDLQLNELHISVAKEDKKDEKK